MAATRGPTLSVSVVRTGSTAVVRVAGELDVATAPRLAAELDDLINEAARPERVVVEADQLTFVDASGLGPLLDARRRLPPGALRLRNVRPQVLRVLRLLDLADAFGVDG